ncbi:flavodoxin [Cumulibacter manganitolerans]|uniref:flavodoxin n=1 Tax=Cumulibacter manganitolerans TaxID=1884992 RepID=UPI00188628AA|nr:flavodoxin [Cumulibacter manganitolerans]
MSDRKKVLVVHHTVSISTAAVHEAALQGLGIEELGVIEACSLPALTAGAHDTLTAAGVVLLSPVNIGYLAGAMKHYFDQIYYPCLEATKSLPFAAVLHSNSDASGALRALEAITTGMQWQPVADPLVVAGDPDAEVREQIAELAGTVGAYAAGMT